MKYLSILKDSLYETIDFKLFYVLIGLSVLLTVGVASFTFPRLPAQEALENNLGKRAADQLAQRTFMFDGEAQDRIRKRLQAATATVSELEVLQESRFRRYARYQFTLTPQEPGQLHAGLREAVKMRNEERERERALGRFSVKSGTDQEPPVPASSTEWSNLVRDYLQSIPGVKEANVLQIDATDKEPPKRVVADIEVNWAELHFAHKMGFLFGVWKIDLDQPQGLWVLGFQIALVDWIAGWAGIIIAVIISAGFIPNMLRKGTIDFLIVKPISRPVLLVYKYLGGLTFVFLNAVVLVTGSWLAFGFNSGNWSLWYLASIVVLTFYFAILYSLSVLIGVLTRSMLASILITIGFWFFLYIVNQVFTGIHLPQFESEIPKAVLWAVDTVHFLLPKPSDLSILNKFLLMQGTGSEEMLRQQKELMSKFSWTETIATSTAFIAVMLALASWRFSRKDY